MTSSGSGGFRHGGTSWRVRAVPSRQSGLQQPEAPERTGPPPQSAGELPGAGGRAPPWVWRAPTVRGRGTCTSRSRRRRQNCSRPGPTPADRSERPHSVTARLDHFAVPDPGRETLPSSLGDLARRSTADWARLAQASTAPRAPSRHPVRLATARHCLGPGPNGRRDRAGLTAALDNPSRPGARPASPGSPGCPARRVYQAPGTPRRPADPAPTALGSRFRSAAGLPAVPGNPCRPAAAALPAGQAAPTGPAAPTAAAAPTAPRTRRCPAAEAPRAARCPRPRSTPAGAQRNAGRPPTGRGCPAVRGPAVRLPASRGPAVRLPAVRLPAVRRPAVRGPAVRGPAVRGPASRRPASRGPPVRRPASRRPASRGPAGRRGAVRRAAVRRPGPAPASARRRHADAARCRHTGGTQIPDAGPASICCSLSQLPLTLRRRLCPTEITTSCGKIRTARYQVCWSRPQCSPPRCLPPQGTRTKVTLAAPPGTTEDFGNGQYGRPPWRTGIRG